MLPPSGSLRPDWCRTASTAPSTSTGAAAWPRPASRAGHGGVADDGADPVWSGPELAPVTQI